MSDTASGNQPSRASNDRDSETGSVGSSKKTVAKHVPLSNDQATVISSRSPIQPSSQVEDAKPDQPGEFPPRTQLGHFELLEYVGGGGMGRVFQALDTRLGRIVALKVLSRSQAEEMETLMRFRNEARSAARLNHPGVVQVYFVGEEEGLPFIAFEFVEGMNVRDLVVQRGPLPLAEALSYTLQVAEALAHAADHKVVHRDIKPSNVLVGPGGRTKLIDMGLARLQKAGDSEDDLTASGVTLGTFDYISPEQARDPRNADKLSDIYSLGCALFYMLAGCPPFPEGGAIQKLLQHQGDEPPDIREFRPELPEETSRVLRKMMAKEPHRRYGDSRALIEALQSLAEQVGLRPMGAGHTMWAVPREPNTSFIWRSTPWLIPTAALVVIVFLLDVFWSPSAQEDDRLRTAWNANQAAGAVESTALGQSSASNETTENEQGQADSSAAPTDGTLASESAAPGHSENEGGTPAVEVDQTTEPDDAVGQPEPPGTDPLLDPVKPNPLGQLAAAGSSGEGLAPEAVTGSLSLFTPASLGISVDLMNLGTPVGLNAGATSAADEPEGVLAPIPSGVLVVDPAGETDGVFATLGAAIGAAESGDVIELRYNGRLDAEPIALDNLAVTVRPGNGFRPVIGFGPSEIDPIKHPCSMFTLNGGQLTLIDVPVELDVPREVLTDSWSLFEIGQGARVSLRKCWATIRNASDRQTAYHQEVAFFRVQAAPGAEIVMPDEPTAVQPVSVELTDCIVRGEAVFLRVRDLQPVDVFWENGLLATTERFLHVEDGEEGRQLGEHIYIELKHLTAMMDGLCLLNHGRYGSHQLVTQIRCAGSVLIAAGESPLIEQMGIRDAGESRDQIRWEGEGNFYWGFSDFWTVRYSDPDIPPKLTPFDEWTSWWEYETSPTVGPPPEIILSERAGRAVHQLTPADFAAAKFVTGEDSADGSTDVEPSSEEPDSVSEVAPGFRADTLPQLPAEVPSDQP